MQPKDVAFMRPVSLEYTDVVIVFQSSYRTVTMKDIFYLFDEAFKKATKVEIAVNAFR